MKKTICILTAMAGLAGLMTGCVQTVDQQSQFGIPGLPDTVQGQYNRTVDQALTAARKVINTDGQLKKDESVTHSLVGVVKGVNIYIRVDEVNTTEPATKVIVQARTTGGAADLTLATSILNEIVVEMTTHPQ